jgi:hypothetical protein
MAEASTAPAPVKGPGRPRLTGPQAAAARQLVAFAAGLPVSPEARILALTVAGRAARDGAANLTSVDVSRYPDPQGVLDELAAGRWIAGDDLARIAGADPAEAFRIQAARCIGLVEPPMGEQMRSRVSGWISRTLAAKPLKKTTATSRLTALALVLAADPTTGVGVLPDLAEQVLADLSPKWITLLDGGGYQLSDLAADCLPVIHQPASAVTGTPMDDSLPPSVGLLRAVP